MAHALENGRLIHIYAAQQGVDYECPDCGGRMCPVQGAVKAWHWRHIADGGWCGYSGYGSETVAHLAAKEILERDRWLLVPPGRARAGKREYSVPGVPGGVVRFTEVLVEQARGSIRPDLIGVLEGGRELLIEVCVTHRVDSGKRAEIERLGVPCVEIVMGPDMDPHAASIEWVWHPAIAAEQKSRTAEYDAWLLKKREAEALDRARGEAEVENYFRSMSDGNLLKAAARPYGAIVTFGIGFSASLLAAQVEVERRGGSNAVSSAIRRAAAERQAREKARQADAEAARVREARDRELIAVAVRRLSSEELSAVRPETWRTHAPTGVSFAARWEYVEAAVIDEVERRAREANDARNALIARMRTLSDEALNDDPASALGISVDAIAGIERAVAYEREQRAVRAAKRAEQDREYAEQREIERIAQEQWEAEERRVREEQEAARLGAEVARMEHIQKMMPVWLAATAEKMRQQDEAKRLKRRAEYLSRLDPKPAAAATEDEELLF